MAEDPSTPAGIEYHGVPGASDDCKDAVLRLLQFGNCVARVRIISASNQHCLILTSHIGDITAIKSGFASGYLGEGPRAFSLVLRLLSIHGAEIEEYAAHPSFIERIDSSALTQTDMEELDRAKAVRGPSWMKYIIEEHWEGVKDGKLWREFPTVIPFGIIDPRIADLAVSFWTDPDNQILKGYRRLEDLIRKRSKLNGHGAKLFSNAFRGKDAPLRWVSASDSEIEGRVQLFVGTYSAHRNNRAHQEIRTERDALVSEFLLLNHLFRLESESEIDF